MAIPIINNWQSYFEHPEEGLGSSYERIILNQILLDFAKKYKVKSVLESPCFGFTGLSGINLAALAKEGINVHLEDHDLGRIAKIAQLWESLNLSMDIRYNPDYRCLDYPRLSFDLSFSFSALWFCQDLPLYLSELAKVSKKCILICVPNRSGLGYKSQVQEYDPQLYPQLAISHIDAPSFIYLLDKLGWVLKEQRLFDCPLWPDIGMSKEDFLHKKLHLNIRRNKEQNKAEEPLNIMAYYRGEDEDFASRMMRYSFLEQHAPQALKRIWAHHEYFLFEPKP